MQEMDAKTLEDRRFRGVSVVVNILCKNVNVGKPMVKSQHRCSREFPTDGIPTGMDLSCRIPKVADGAYLKLCEDSKCFPLLYIRRKWPVVAIFHKCNLGTCAVRYIQQPSIDSLEFGTPDDRGELYDIRRNAS